MFKWFWTIFSFGAPVRSLVRFLIRQQLVRKYRTPALSMKYSLYLTYSYKPKAIDCRPALVMWQRIQTTFLLPSQYFPYITRGFKIACLNITSLSKQIDKLPVLLDDKWFDIILSKGYMTQTVTIVVKYFEVILSLLRVCAWRFTRD